MNKTEIEERFKTLFPLCSNERVVEFVYELRAGVLEHISKLEEENKIQKEIMDQQAKLILEKGKCYETV